MQYVNRFLLICILLCCAINLQAQNSLITHLKNKLRVSENDSIKAYTLDSLSMYYMFYEAKYDSAFSYLTQFVNTGFALKDKKYLVLAYARFGFYYLNIAELNAGLDISLKGLQLARQNNITDFNATLYYDLSFIYYNLGDSALSMQNALKGEQALLYNKDPFYDIPLHLYGHISSIYADHGNLTPALRYLALLDAAAKISKERAANDISYYYWTNYFFDIDNYTKADSVISLGIASCKNNGDFLLTSFYYFQVISYFNKGRYRESISTARLVTDSTDIGTNASILGYVEASFGKLGKPDSAYHYLKKADSLQRIVRKRSDINQTRQLQFNQQLQQKEAEASLAIDSEKNKNKIRVYVFVTVLLSFLILAFTQWRSSMHRKRANILLQAEKEKVENTFKELTATQAQLVQSEKMASLGELTAGIAHEIQNPLNFVNNFSEVSTELIDEMNEEINKGNLEDVKEIANDLKQNLEKINHHGKRAGDIVKGMLQHSRSNSGVKEPTNINKLADEYLRLAYHGLRAKDNSFNVTMKTDFDETIGNINMITQDIGRVLLNLYNNAFYAVTERRKLEGIGLPAGQAGYEPLVSVGTKKVNNKIEIRVHDNGNGIPKNIVDKIFQPFFTTKPTGQGTGLGLSLSYDIVKAHGGEIKVETLPTGRQAKEGEGTIFIIQLPIVSIADSKD